MSVEASTQQKQYSKSFSTKVNNSRWKLSLKKSERSYKYVRNTNDGIKIFLPINAIKSKNSIINMGFINYEVKDERTSTQEGNNWKYIILKFLH